MLVVHFLVPMLGSFLFIASARRISFLSSMSAHKQRAFFVTSAVFPALLTMFFELSPFILWCLIGSLVVILRVLGAFYPHFPSDFSLEDALSLLDQVILSMKSGRPLRSSLLEARRSFSTHKMSRVLQELTSRFEHGGHFSGSRPVAKELLHEFLKLEAQGTRMIPNLESFRSSLRTQFIFRRRSSQATLQARLQAGVSLVLYAPLLVMNAWLGSFFELRTVISMILFISAQLWIHFFSRRHEWKV